MGTNSLPLLGTALLFNNLAGRSYPHRAILAAAGPTTADPSPAARVGFTSADLDAVLAGYDQLLDVDRGDLEQILRGTEIRSYRRRADPRGARPEMSKCSDWARPFSRASPDRN